MRGEVGRFSSVRGEDEITRADWASLTTVLRNGAHVWDAS
jgi:hypothetical protein